jgi:hypothetical protein
MNAYFDHEKLNDYRRAHRFERVAHAPRVLVSASRRNNLSPSRTLLQEMASIEKVRDREDAITSRRDACATHNMLPREEVDSAFSFEQEQEQEKE